MYVRASHHSGPSGFDRVAQYAGRTIPLAPMVRWPSGRLPRWTNSALSLLTGHPWYTAAALRAEVAMVRDMGQRRAEIYHNLYGDNDLLLGPFANGWRGHKLVATVHQPPEMLGEAMPSLRGALQRLTAVTVVGTNQVEYLSSIVGSRRVFVTPHGIDTEFFAPLTREARSNTFRCIFVGLHLRDLATLSGVIDAVSARSRDVWFDLVVAQSAQMALPHTPQVRVLSGVSDLELRSLYQGADVLLLPLRNATANNTLLEAMACGLPAVVSDVGGIRDYTGDDEAILTPVGNVDRMADAIMALVEDRRLRETMGLAARRRAEGFAYERMAERLFEVYRAIEGN